jgi:DNA-binding NarL/FixJ family response regulator
VILSAVQRVHAGELWIDRGTTARVFSSLARTHADGVRDCARSDVLTRRERWIVASVVRHKGAPNKVIADDLHISGHTLRNHLASIYSKLGVHRRLDLVLYAIERGLAQQPDV